MKKKVWYMSFFIIS